MNDDFCGKFIFSILIGFMLLYGIYHLGRWHQRTIDYADQCEPSVVCKTVKNGLDCYRVAYEMF